MGTHDLCRFRSRARADALRFASGRSLSLGLRRLLFPALLVALAGTSVPRAHSDSEPSALAGRVAALLENARTGDALRSARAAVHDHPRSPVLYLRLAQAHLCDAFGIDRRIERELDDAAYAKMLPGALDMLHRAPAPETSDMERAVDDRRRLLEIAESDTLKQLLDRVREQAKAIGPALDARDDATRAAADAAGQALRLGDDSTERAVTALWVGLAELLWAKDRNLVEAGAGGRPASVGSQDPTPGPSLLRAAGELARKRPHDSAALAGAADIVAVAAQLMDQPDPLLRYIMTRPAQPNAAPGESEPALRLYRQMLEASDPDPVKTPSAAILQWYRRALENDPHGRLPFLRMRVYLLTVPFEPEYAAGVLTELERADPRNAAVPLERARSLMLERKTPALLRELRAAGRMPRVSRSYFCGLPGSLRPAVKYQRTVRALVRNGWPDHHALFGILQQVQLSAPRPVLIQLGLLRLRLAETLCGAVDYPDQALGIDQKTRVLAELADPGAGLPAGQRALLEKEEIQHARRYDYFPRSRSSMEINTAGVGYQEYPQLLVTARNDMGPRLSLIPPSGRILFPSRDRR